MFDTTEKELQQKLSERLKEYFYVQREVSTNCKTGRIDLVLTCKTTKAIMGVEIKRVDRKRGKDIGMLIKQASRYAQASFTEGKTKMPVFIFPAISYDYIICPEEKKIIQGSEYFKDRHDKASVHHTFQGILGVFDIGELRVFPHKDKNYIRFVFNNKLIWTNQPQYQSKEIIGLHDDNYKDLINRLHGNDI